jgi:hypothetical protein
MKHLKTTVVRRAGALALVGILGLAGPGLHVGQAATMHHPGREAATDHAAQGTSLRTLALSLQDVTAAFGSGFRQQPGSSLGNDVLNSRINAKVGRISGYGTMYMRQHPGPIMVDSGVNLFRNQGFAAASVRRVYTVFSSPQNRKDGVRVARLQGLGDAALILTYDLGTQKGVHFRELCVMFSQGTYAADVILVAGGAIDHAKLLSLAHTMDRRITNA